MLKVNKETSEFLVTAEMANEVKNFISNFDKKISNIAQILVEKNIKKIYFVGCGSSKAVGDSGKFLLRKYSKIGAEAFTGWDFVDDTPMHLDEETAVVLISHSGKTEEVIKSLEIATKKGAFTIGVVNSAVGNPLGEEANVVIDYGAEAMWECHLLALYMLVGHYVEQTDPNEEMRKVMNDIPKLPEVLEYHISEFESTAMEIVKKCKDWKGFYMVAAGELKPLAYKEGVITNMEFMWGHGAVIESGEFRHGPLEMVEEGVPFVVLLGTGESRHTTERALNFIEKYKGETIVFDYKDFSKGLHPDLAPMTMFVPLEWFSFYFALVRDHNPDDRRYYNVVKY